MPVLLLRVPPGLFRIQQMEYMRLMAAQEKQATL